MRCTWKADLIRLCKFTFDNLFVRQAYKNIWEDELKGKRQLLHLRTQGNKVHCIPGIAMDAASELKDRNKRLQENSFNIQSSIFSPRKLYLILQPLHLKQNFLFHSPRSVLFSMQESTHHKILLYAVMQVPVISALT